jgi:hypothetical protein
MRQFFLALLFSFVCVVQASAETTPPALIGTWIIDVKAVKEFGLPDECSNIKIQFNEGGEALLWTGELVYKVTFTVKKEGIGFRIYKTPIENNGKPNCQKRSASYVFANFQNESYVEIQGEQLHHHLWEKKDPFLLFKKQ